MVNGENMLESDKNLTIGCNSTFLQDPEHTVRATKHVYLLKRQIQLSVMFI